MTAEYDKMTRSERRVAICKDVIQNINERKIKIDEKNYINTIYLWKNSLYHTCESKESTKATINVIKKYCEVCAISAMMLSRIEKFKSVRSFNPIFGRNYIVNRLSEAFSKKELLEIEVAFEKFASSKKKRHINALKFTEGFAEPVDRLLAIMQNIVDHDGTFTPECEYVII